jgi:hypothetical protein
MERGNRGKGDALRAVSMPHFSTTQGVAACLMASMFLHTQAKSVAWHDVVATACRMHGSEHSGKMEMSWAEVVAAAARARMAVVYFIVAVVA